jgi:ABC-type lipoprotein export system ATPase subunit
MLEKISIIGGQDKNGHPEPVHRLDIRTGEVLAVVGPTGSGKTQLISDIEQYAEGETPTRRSILINDLQPESADAAGLSNHLVAEVSQKMNFVIDTTVREFLLRHARIRGIDAPEKIAREVLTITNTLAGEPVSPEDNLTTLSGGQARALMVGDVALISNAPVVLIDEIENAGIDRLRALDILSDRGKIVLVVTHDLALMLMARRRVVMKNGGMVGLHHLTREEKEIADRLAAVESETVRLRDAVRNGICITETEKEKESCTPWKKYCFTAH